MIKDYLAKNKIFLLDKSRRLPAVVKLVAKIPYGQGRSVSEVLETNKVGTCTGKHLVLGACFDELGIEYKNVVCTFRWGDQSIKYPENLRKILEEGEWEHGHNFLQVKTDEEFFDIDVTWNPELKPYGFLALPEDWDGKSSFLGIEKIIRRWDGVDVDKTKKQLVDSLEEKVIERRQRFLRQFFKWIESINNF